jgi:U5 small nuclear ribonucleoprotein component
LTEPIIAPVRKNKFQHVEQELPETSYDAEFMADMMDNGCLVRLVAVSRNTESLVLFLNNLKFSM